SDASLVAVEGEEVAAVHPGLLGPSPAAGLTPAGLLHLDHVGPQPRQQLCAGRAGLELGQVQDADAVQGFAHSERIIAGAGKVCYALSVGARHTMTKLIGSPR